MDGKWQGSGFSLLKRAVTKQQGKARMNPVGLIRVGDITMISYLT